MKRNLYAVVLFILAGILPGLGQEAEHKPMLDLKGYVNLDFIYDSRETVSAREGSLLLYPAARVPDVDDNDINAQPNLNMLAIQTRLTALINGPDAFGAKTSGLIEGEFFGHSDPDINGFRLRHAFMKFRWSSISLLFGQYWHPFFFSRSYPGVVSFNGGIPFQPFARNPQIRLTRETGNTILTAALSSQRDFTSPGGSLSLRNAVLPNLTCTVQQKAGKHLFGAGVDYKKLIPRVQTDSLYKTTESVSGISFNAFSKLDIGGFTWKLEAVAGQNLYDQLMLGGYAVTDYDVRTGREKYTVSRNYSVWSDLSFGKKVEKGLFAGYTENLGVSREIKGRTYMRGASIDHVFRIAPRVKWFSGKTRFAAEVDYTLAAYGTPDSYGKVQDAEAVANVRFLFAVHYFFNR